MGYLSAPMGDCGAVLCVMNRLIPPIAASGVTLKMSFYPAVRKLSHGIT